MVTFNLPSGPMNLRDLFPNVDFNKVEEYYLELRGQLDGQSIVTTNKFKRSCCCNDDTIRLFFINYLGAIDAINLSTKLEELNVSSSRWKKPLQIPMAKWDGGTQRFNVEANKIVTAENTCFKEKDQEWLDEFLASPNYWVQWFGTQGQDNDYIPVVVSDGKFVTRKSEQRFNYVLQVQFEYANEILTLRN